MALTPMSFRGFLRCAALLLAAVPAVAQTSSVTGLIAKAQAAWQHNRAQVVYWNWTTTETRIVLDSSGRELQRLPDVSVESAIRSDGKRCNAVLSWGDGTAPYKLNEDADARCGSKD